MRVGIFGGSFNPVHLGHLHLADHAYSELNLDRLYFVPSNQTPLKQEKDLLPAVLRVKLLGKALKSRPHFSVSDCEVKRGGKSFTVDTLRYFRKKSGKAAQLYFLTGMDSVASLARWKDTESLFKLCRFVVATRPGHSWKETKYPVIRLPFDALDISSSKVRSLLQVGRSVADILPAEIIGDLKVFYQSTVRGKKGDAKSKRKRNLS